MRAFTKAAVRAVTFVVLGASVAVAQSTNTALVIDGRWDATITTQGTVIPFRLDIAGSGPALKGILFDGTRPNDGTSSATFENNKLTLKLDQYLTTISATLQDGKLTGYLVTERDTNAKKVVKAGATNADANATEIERLQKVEFGENPYGSSAFQAVRHVDTAEAALADVPQIGGSWIIPLSSLSIKGESAFRFIVKQQGAYVEASILRVDGDTGAYSGTYKDGKWLLSHFDGGRPGVIEVTLQKDGSLEIGQLGGIARKKPATQEGNSPDAASDVANVQTSGRYSRTLVAYRPEVEKAKGLPQPDDYQTHTGIRDPDEVFKFNFPDDHGKLRCPTTIHSSRARW
jgi:hypothetical protein